ncbi:MAG: glycoside hydrolase family 3 protein [Phenylobacterium sp.]|nr:beta-glucosidase [Phenylobacterium sp. Root700]MBT9473170.1 glycoside hydrolase family 3 protein [Phenylobacterium sp.]
MLERRWRRRGVELVAVTAMAWTASAAAQDRTQAPAQRAAATVGQMTLDEKLSLVHGYFGASLKGAPPPMNATPPKEALGGAGYVPGVSRLGVPALQESDASLGVANGGNMRPGDQATALPSGLATASTWNPQLAHDGGAMIGTEAHAKGFNVLLAGGVNLARDPRNGRNFEYLGEDTLLAGVMAGESIAGIQSRHVISTVKHFAINDQETGRMTLSSDIDEKAMRETDLLAFEIAIERGKPGAVMCSYNRINGEYGCENDFLLNKVLKGDWAYPGWVMSDWGGVHSTVKAAMGGLDQESAHTFDKQDFFGAPLKAAVESGQVPMARLDDMAGRILHSMYAVGVVEHPPVKRDIDKAAHAAVAQKVAEEGAVLLKNEGGLLPLAAQAKSIAVIGAHADVGVLSGAGSSQVISYGGSALELPGKGAFGGLFKIVYHASSPMKAIAAAAPGAKVSFSGGQDIAAAVAAAKQAEVAIVFAEQWQTEIQDAPNLSLPDGQDALIAAVAAANPRTIVVLQTGNPVLMPWLSNVGAVLEVWYPGQRGGEAIANILFGKVNPSGKLPISFPQSEAQLPRPKIPGSELKFVLFGGNDPLFSVPYPEGSEVGYRGFEARGQKPLFPFGHGLSYTHFTYGGLKVAGGETLKVSFTLTNAGAREGMEVAQVYATPPGQQRRLIGWKKVALKPGETRKVEVSADPRLLAEYDVKAPGWRVSAGDYAVAVGASSADLRLNGASRVTATLLKP